MASAGERIGASARARTPRAAPASPLDWSPLWIALVYAALGILWIVWSDAAVLAVVRDQEALTRLQTYKGWFFVVASAALIYFLVGRRVNRSAPRSAPSDDRAVSASDFVTILEATTDLVS